MILSIVFLTGACCFFLYKNHNFKKRNNKKLEGGNLATYMAEQESVEIKNAIYTLNRIYDMQNNTNPKTFTRQVESDSRLAQFIDSQDSESEKNTGKDFLATALENCQKFNEEFEGTFDK